MIEYSPRKFKFKAWNTETRLLQKLSSIDCVKGELFKKNHILLQFTGLADRHGEELYEMDVVLVQSEKFVVVWEADRNGWALANAVSGTKTGAFSADQAIKTTRLCSYFESTGV